MSVELSVSEDYASVFQQQIRSFREKLDLESKSRVTGQDRISELPNNVLCHILSFVPSTKEVVRTGVLSTRWKNVWAYVPNLFFNDVEFSSSTDFIAFVDRVLHVRDSSAIQRFQLHFNNCQAEHFSQIDSWVSTAVRCNVVELDLSINPKEEEMFELPISLLTCKTLKVLSLSSIYFINMRTSACYCFPSLICLHIYFKIFEPEFDEYDQLTVSHRGDISMTLFHFPVLEYLSLNGDLGPSLLDFNITAPELKTLRIDLYSSNDLHDLCNFSIDAAKLIKLDLRESSLSIFNFMNSKSLLEANIDLHMYHNEDYVQQDSIKQANVFLAQIQMVKYLSLSSSIYQACSMPKFNNLSKLTLNHWGGSHWWRILIKVLERSPILECLEIDDGFYPTRRQMEEEVIRVAEQKKKVIRVAERKKKLTEPTDRGVVVIDLAKYAKVLNWIPPESVPNCLSSHLKTISIKGFKGKGHIGYLDEMALTKYLLINSRVLEKMTVYTPGLHRIYTPGLRRGTTEEIYNELSMVELGSEGAQVEVIEQLFYRCEGGYKISIFS